MSIFKNLTINAMVAAVDDSKRVVTGTNNQRRKSHSGDPSNEDRAASALAALESQEKYHGAWPEGLGDSIVDLVSDLLHLAHQNDIEPDYVIRMAQTHFDAEIEEEAEHGDLD